MSRAVHANGRVWAVFRDGTLRHATPTPDPDWQPAPQLTSPVVALATTEHNASVFAACRDGSLHLFRAHTAELVISSPAPLHAVPLCLLPLPIENALFVGLQDGAVVRCHLTSLAFDCMLGCGVEHSAAVNALEADEQYLYSGGEDAVVLVWDLKGANAVREISMPSAAICSLLRVDVALWVGETDGTVEIFDIFGDDCNGIERICGSAPHAGPVTDLVKVGDTEVWSLAAAPAHADVAPEHAASVAVWDTRDMSFDLSSSIQSTDLMSVMVVNRVPYEEVTVFALTNSLGPQIVSKKVRGSLCSATDALSDNYNEVFSDLETRLVEANEELHDIRSAPSYRKKSAKRDSTLIMSPVVVSNLDLVPVSAHPFDDDSDDHNTYSSFHHNGACQDSPALSGSEGPTFTLSKSVSETLVNSLQHISELLVTLLTDDVLSPSEGHTRGSNDDLRSAVATITRELNIGRQLIECCTATTISDTSVIMADENEFGRNLRNPLASCLDVAKVQLRKRLDKEIESRHALEKDLAVVTGERDLFMEDLQLIKAQSDSTMSQLEGIIRDKDAKAAALNELVAELRKEYKRMETTCHNEASRREQMEETLRKEMAELLNSSEQMKKAYEEKLTMAYDKIEIKSIQIKSQRDSLRASEKCIEELRSSNSSMEKKCESLETNVSELLERTQVVEEESSKLSELKLQHENELRKVKPAHKSAMEDLQAKHNDALGELRSRCHELQSVDSAKDVSLVELRRDVESLQASLKSALSNDVTAGQTESTSMASDQGLEESRSKIVASIEISELRRELETAKLQASEMKIGMDKTIFNIQERDKKIAELKSNISELQAKTDAEAEDSRSKQVELGQLKEENASLEEEIQHRRFAAELYEKEAGELRLACSKYKTAAEELQSVLSGTEQDIENLNAQLDELKQGAFAKDARIKELEQQRLQSDGDKTEAITVVEDSKTATQALLASANGEIEQMSAQLEAMHTAHTEQEKELAALRSALLSRRFNVSKSPASLPTIDASQTEKQIGSRDTDGSRNDVLNCPVLSTPEDSLITSALREIQEGMVMTQDKLRLLSKMARKYRESAQSHLNILPALRELEAELSRVSGEDTRKAGRLARTRGVIQSVIALYFSAAEKRAVFGDYDEAVYRPSSERLQALQTTLSHMRALRTGSQHSVITLAAQGCATIDSHRTLRGGGNVDDLPTPRRLLTY